MVAVRPIVITRGMMSKLEEIEKALEGVSSSVIGLLSYPDILDDLILDDIKEVEEAVERLNLELYRYKMEVHFRHGKEMI